MKLYIAIAVLALIWLPACSGSGDTPISPDTPEGITSQSEPVSNHSLWGMWEINLDTVELTAGVLETRNAQAHYNITQLILPPACDNCLAVAVNSFDPVTRIMDLDVTLRNPHPVSGYDVRGILFTNDAGHELRNADAWTKLHDIGGGGLINPFKAFAKTIPNRMFGGAAEYTEKYLVYIPTPPQYQSITFAVDASWPGNCNEPYDIDNFVQHDILYNVAGHTATIRVQIHDWQDDVDKVTIVVPEVTGESFTQLYHITGPLWGQELTNNAAEGPGEFEARIIAESANSGDLVLYDYVTVAVLDAPTPVVTGTDPENTYGGVSFPGFSIEGSGFQGPDAQVVLSRDSIAVIEGENVFVESPNLISCSIDVPLYLQPGTFDVEVTNFSGKKGTGTGVFELLAHAPDNIQDVTPPWLNFGPREIASTNGLVFIAAGMHGLHIFDVSNPVNPVWVSSVSIDFAFDVDVTPNYAFVGDAGGLHIIDYTPPESAHILKTVSTSYDIRHIVAGSGYVYITDTDAKMHIVDVDPPMDASIIKTVEISSSANAIDHEGEYVYVLTDFSSNDLQIIDVNPASIAYVEKTINASGHGIDVENGYAHVGDQSSGWDYKIYDVDPPSTAAFLTQKSCPSSAVDPFVYGDFCLMAVESGGMAVIDILNIATPVVKDVVPTPFAVAITVKEGVAYIADEDAGLFAIDVNSPAYSNLLSEVNTPGFTESVAVAGSNLYCCIENGGVLVYDISEPGVPQLRDRIPLYGPGFSEYAEAVSAYGDYAYAATNQETIAIIHAPPAGPVYQLDYVSTYGDKLYDLFATEDYIYTGAYEAMHAINVTDPASAYIEKAVTIPGGSYGVWAGDGYAYLASYQKDLHIVDIDPLPSANLYNSVTTTYEAYDVVVDNGYAYVCSSMDGLDIIDIDPPDSASVSLNLDTHRAYDVSKMGDYVYIASDATGLWVVNAANPLGASTYTAFGTPYKAYGVATVAGYAYVADRAGGLRVLDLW